MTPIKFNANEEYFSELGKMWQSKVTYLKCVSPLCICLNELHMLTFEFWFTQLVKVQKVQQLKFIKSCGSRAQVSFMGKHVFTRSKFADSVGFYKVICLTVCFRALLKERTCSIQSVLMTRTVHRNNLLGQMVGSQSYCGGQ